MKKLNLIGLSAAVTFIISLLIKLITSKLIINLAATTILLIAVLVILSKKKISNTTLLSIVLPSIVCIIVAIFLPNLLQVSIAALLLSLIVVEKVPETYRPVTWIILFTVLLTWILPTTYYSYSLTSDGTKSQVGIFDLLSYPNVSLSYFGNIVLYILVIGGFYGVLHNIPAYRNILDKIVKKSKGKEMLIISIIMAIITLFTSICGASMGLWIVIPFIISLVLLMGYDKMTAAMVSVGSIVVGLIGTTFSSTYIADSYSVTAQNGMGVVNTILDTTATNLIGAKIIILILGLGLLILNLYMKSKKNTKKAEIKEFLPVESEQKSKAWPLIVVFDAVTIITLLALTSWTSVFKTDIFTKATEAVTSKFTLWKFPIIGKLLGTLPAFESWGITEITSLVALATVLLAVIYKVNINKLIENISSGIKKALKPAIIVALIYVVLIIVSYNPIVLTITNPILKLTSKLNPVTMSIVALITSIFNVDLYYAASTTLQYVTELFKSSMPVISLIWQTMYGLAQLAAPTSVILMAVLTYLDIPYKKWLKSNWILILGMLAICLITSTVLILI